MPQVKDTGRVEKCTTCSKGKKNETKESEDEGRRLEGKKGLTCHRSGSGKVENTRGGITRTRCTGKETSWVGDTKRLGKHDEKAWGGGEAKKGEWKESGESEKRRLVK